MKKINSKERVRRAFKHLEVNRTPIFERLIQPPTSDLLLDRLCAVTNFLYRQELLVRGNWQQLVDQQARDIVDLAEILGFDMVAVGRNVSQNYSPIKRIGTNTWEDEGGIVTRYIPESDSVKRFDKNEENKSVSWKEENTIEKIKAGQYGEVKWDESEFYVFHKVKELLAERDMELAIYVSNYLMPVATLPSYMFTWFYNQPELLHDFYSQCSQKAIALGLKFVELGADVIGLGGDFASNTGPLISPEHYRQFITPHIQDQVHQLHQAGEVFVTNTTDGNVWPVLEDFLINSGVDGYGEIQKDAGMDLGKLKEEVGDTICFLGNLDIRNILCSGTEEDSRREMIECIEKGWGNGGHIIMTGNVVHRDVKPQNYLAALSAYRDYFNYRQDELNSIIKKLRC